MGFGEHLLEADWVSVRSGGFQILNELGGVALDVTRDALLQLLEEVCLVPLNCLAVGVKVLLRKILRHFLVLDYRVSEEVRELFLSD